ncbi:hypothetical protein IWW34DRAFT_767566 [Fusarium oxysporum f. sp. albedinis]|nr:hypothetical protein IWW34DRAFT_767566 [Fusarium oxysporum f. sp. albedinis]
MDSQQLISQAVNAYDDNSFIRVDDSRREQPADNTSLNPSLNTCRPIHDPILDRGYNFEAMVVPTRPFEITALPSEPLLLFPQFVPIYLHEDGTQRLHPQSRLLAWKPTSTAKIYVWLAT